MSIAPVLWARARPGRLALLSLAAALVVTLTLARTRLAPEGLACLCDPDWTVAGAVAVLALVGAAAAPAGATRTWLVGTGSPRGWGPLAGPPIDERPLGLHALHGVAVLLVSIAAFSANREHLLAGYDGAFYRTTTDLQYAWSAWGPYLGPHLSVVAVVARGPVGHVEGRGGWGSAPDPGI